MDIDEMRNEALKCLHLATHATEACHADDLRGRADRLARLADLLDRPGPALLGNQPSLRGAGVQPAR